MVIPKGLLLLITYAKKLDSSVAHVITYAKKLDGSPLSYNYSFGIISYPNRTSTFSNLFVIAFFRNFFNIFLTLFCWSTNLMQMCLNPKLILATKLGHEVVYVENLTINVHQV